MNIRIPKGAAFVGALVSAAGVVAQNAPALQQVPALQHSNTLTSIVTIAGLVLAWFGTPPHHKE